ncbi:MAG: DinB family protein [Nitrolancea sp.]
MATKQEIIESINAGIGRVEQTFGSLSDEQLEQKVHDVDGGWTAKQILAHLAGRQGSYDAIVAMAEGSAPPFTSGVDDWNQQAVDQRIGMSRDELLNEFRKVHQGLIERVRGMDDELLSATIELPRGSAAVSDVLAGSGGRHSITHSAEVEAALGLSAPGE